MFHMERFSDTFRFAPAFRVPRETSCIRESSLLDFRWRGIIWLGSSRLQIKKVEWAKLPRL